VQRHALVLLPALPFSHIELEQHLPQRGRLV
jgi:hypothetical protein